MSWRDLRLLVGVFALACLGCTETPSPANANGSAVAVNRALGAVRLLQGDAQGYRVADRPRAFVFPADHGPHPGYRTEWWYFTGHLKATVAPARAFGFQFTIFRQALRPPGSVRGKSAWWADDAYLAHLAVTDVAATEHAAAARLARGVPGLAGPAVSGDGLRLDVDGWTLARTAGDAWRIVARAMPGDLAERAPGEPANSALALNLELEPRAEPLAHGVAGLSRKGPKSASYYYSIPRLAASGRVRTAAGEFEVTGEAWLDREWSTSALAPEQRGWDWFSVVLDDGSELMLFQLRRVDGTRDAFDAGTLRRGGRVQHLRAGDFEARPLATWRDEQGREWPIDWAVTVPSAGLALRVRAVIADQLMRLGLEYWEGAVTVTGSRRGQGYLEMTGYGDLAES